MSQQIGYALERQASDFLSKQGLSLITRNYRCRWGEVDLIMQDKAYLVFVEVRGRVSEEYGGALGSIILGKQKKIIKSALHFLMTHPKYKAYPARFDVVCLQGNPIVMEWIKDAFQT